MTDCYLYIDIVYVNILCIVLACYKEYNKVAKNEYDINVKQIYMKS